MRTNIELDDALVEEAFRLTNVRTKKDLLNLALQELIHSRKVWIVEEQDHEESWRPRSLPLSY